MARESTSELRKESSVRQEHMNQIYDNQASSLQNAALLGLLGGGGVAGLKWLYDQINRKKDELPELPASTAVTLTDPSILAKQATVGGRVVGAIDKAVASIPGLDYGYSLPTSASYTRSAIPLTALALLGGLYGGHKLVSGLTGAADESGLADKEEKARAEFEAALQQQFEESHGYKRAMAELSEEEVQQEKRAFGDYTNAALGLGTTAAALVWYLSHKAMLDRMRRQDPEAIELGLLKKRQREQLANQVAPISFNVSTPGEGEEETALERELKKRNALPFAKRRA